MLAITSAPAGNAIYCLRLIFPFSSYVYTYPENKYFGPCPELPYPMGITPMDISIAKPHATDHFSQNVSTDKAETCAYHTLVPFMKKKEPCP